MTEIAANLGMQPRHRARRGAITAEPMQAPAFVSEQQALTSTAAELAGPAVWRHRLLAAVRAHFARAEKPYQPKHYPNYYSFIEHAAMSREMDRL
jgi:hypothetical protein